MKKVSRKEHKRKVEREKDNWRIWREGIREENKGGGEGRN